MYGSYLAYISSKKEKHTLSKEILKFRNKNFRPLTKWQIRYGKFLFLHLKISNRNHIRSLPRTPFEINIASFRTLLLLSSWGVSIASELRILQDKRLHIKPERFWTQLYPRSKAFKMLQNDRLSDNSPSPAEYNFVGLVNPTYVLYIILNNEWLKVFCIF